MNRPRLIRGLRIAWSAVCGILCVLLIVLCLRSYWWADQASVQISTERAIGIISIAGNIDFDSYHFRDRSLIRRGVLLSEAISEEALGWFERPSFQFATTGNQKVTLTTVAVPHWFLAVLSGALASAPWLPWSFSLRTLLIATTLIAVLLGLVVWSMA